MLRYAFRALNIFLTLESTHSPTFTRTQYFLPPAPFFISLQRDGRLRHRYACESPQWRSLLLLYYHHFFWSIFLDVYDYVLRVEVGTRHYWNWIIPNAPGIFLALSPSFLYLSSLSLPLTVISYRILCTSRLSAAVSWSPFLCVTSPFYLTLYFVSSKGILGSGVLAGAYFFDPRNYFDPDAVVALEYHFHSA